MDNPLAFPSGDFTNMQPQDGMTLRDYFAAQVIAAILPIADTVDKRRGSDGVQAKATDYAQIAYVIADAMLAQRAVPPRAEP